MGKTIKNQIPWTKELYDKFVENAILSDLEKKVLHSRVWESDRWTNIKMALEWNTSRTAIDKCLSSIRNKYDYLHYAHPDIYPRRKAN